MHLKPVIKQLYIIHLLCALSLLSLSFSLPFFLSPPISPHPPHPNSLYDGCFGNRYVFGCFLNVTRHWLCLMCTGSEFQVAGPNTENDLFP